MARHISSIKWAKSQAFKSCILTQIIMHSISQHTATWWSGKKFVKKEVCPRTLNGTLCFTSGAAGFLGKRNLNFLRGNGPSQDKKITTYKWEIKALRSHNVTSIWWFLLSLLSLFLSAAPQLSDFSLSSSQTNQVSLCYVWCDKSSMWADAYTNWWNKPLLT